MKEKRVKKQSVISKRYLFENVKHKPHMSANPSQSLYSWFDRSQYQGDNAAFRLISLSVCEL